MSNAMYNKIWHATQDSLDSLLDKESQKMAEPHKNRVFVFDMLATFYIKYVQIFRKLETVYDQMVHPQKRLLIRKMLDGVMGRVLELKNEMVELELTEFHYFDSILPDLKLVPQQLDIPIPRYFLKEKLEVIKGREKILAQILADSGLDMMSLKRILKTIPPDEAIKTIQVAERARQGRLRALFMKQIYLQEYRIKQNKLLGDRALDISASALCIQKVWRAYHESKKTEQMREEEMIFLGMSPPPQFHQVSATLMQAQKVQSWRNDVQLKHEEDYREALVTIKDNLKLVEGPDIKDSLQDQIRHWFIECRNLTGAFPAYPKVEEGGSALIFSNKTPQQVIADILASQEEEDKNKKKKREEKEKKEKAVQRERKGSKERPKEESEEWKMSPSLFLGGMEEGNQLFKDMWKNKDESWNFPQDYDPELIKEEKRKELESEIRLQVDELMRQELINLKLAVDREKELPPRGQKGGNKKKGKKGKKGKRGKKEKDLTANRNTQSLYQITVLLEEGVQTAPKALAENGAPEIGEYSYLGTSLRQVAIEPMPSLLDVRQLITLYGILPLGSATVHEKAPLVKSLLLAGPSGVGKKMLVHAICTETGANLFNLSAANIAGKYPGRSGLQMMLHVVFKVARQLQPSVVWIGDTEKTFYKRVPNDEKESSRAPLSLRCWNSGVWLALALVAAVLWEQIIQRHGGFLTKTLNISCLAKVTDGFTQGHIVQVVKRVLTERRLRQQARRPLSAVEFITVLTGMDPVYKEEEDSFKSWYAKTPLGRRRALALTGGDTEKDKGKKKEKKK
ncbi:dynein regulatory complex protein 11 [Echinops telfairi]|uniref:Dynein regulatory complex protein 11 n=1 Tax=Echinops telfairi TaxID=9371 RepID=A0AC55DEZ7_ECHTE|nr:dynein regulatory complex protein 11 [Echinops telfairi]